MRRISSVFMPKKKDDDRHPKRSWRSWLRRRPEHVPKHDDDDDNSTSTLPLDSLILFTRQSLAVPPSLPPLAPDSLFPRSVSEPAVLPRPQSLRIHVLKSAILHRYENHRHNEQPCTLSDFPNISQPPVSYPSSPGIHRWLSRPCFEDRYVVYTPVDSGITRSQVSASLPVAAIEYPDYLEIMAGPGLHPVAPVTVDPLSSPPRNERLPPPSLSVRSDSPPPMTPTSPVAVKRVVRFAADDDDDDDGVPLHLIRQRKLREQKAKFIKQERLRRAQEEGFNRRQREKEALEKERERAMLGAERAKAEKERKQKQQADLAEGVVKTRLRRELHRAGGVPALVMRDLENGLNLGVVSLSTPPANERNKTHLSTSSSTASLRGVQTSITSRNPRRDSSVDPPSLHLQPQHHQAASDPSPASSRRSSILAPTINTPSPLYQSHFNSRPPSSYSSSSESLGKRNSLVPLMGPPTMGMMSPMAMQMNMMSMPTFAVPQPIIMTYPPFASSNPNISSNPSQAIPPFVPVNSFIDYNNFMPNDIDMQMPLLPPTAPFMKQPSYERRKTWEKEAGERNPRPVSLRSSSGSKRDSTGSSSDRMASVPGRGRDRESTIPSTGIPSAIGTGAGTRKPIPGQRPSQGTAVSSSTNTNLNRKSIRYSTMPVPNPWTGVPTVQQRQQQAELALLNGPSKSGTGGQSVSGTSSSTVKKRGSMMSGIGISKAMAKGKPSMNSNQGRSQAVTW